MNSIIDQQQEDYRVKEQQCINIAVVAGYIRTWVDIDGFKHYELTEKGIIKLATLMV